MIVVSCAYMRDRKAPPPSKLYSKSQLAAIPRQTQRTRILTKCQDGRSSKCVTDPLCYHCSGCSSRESPSNHTHDDLPARKATRSDCIEFPMCTYLVHVHVPVLVSWLHVPLVVSGLPLQPETYTVLQRDVLSGSVSFLTL
jgi:hypothetical protein